MRFIRLGFLVCAAALAACSGESEDCGDLTDNDNNGLIDCADPACPAGSTCGANGFRCTTQLACACPIEGGCTGTAPDEQPSSGAPPVLGSIRVASIEYPVMGARYSGFQEVNEIVFEVLDTAGRPYPAGLPVTFAHVSQGESFIIPNCSSDPSPTCVPTLTTNGAGRVTVLLHSGRRFAILSVRADASAGGVQVSAVANDIAVVGAKPNGAHIGVTCRPYNIPGFAVHDCQRSYWGWPEDQPEPIDCQMATADRHGNMIGIPALVALWSEAGAAGDPSYTVPYAPDAPDEDREIMGRAFGHVTVRGQPLPWDVDPQGGEHYQQEVDFGCGPRTANPRDGLVTIIGMVAGEEGFVDSNANGQYDAGEPFVDIGEPFVDANDDGDYQFGEPFQDVNEDGVWNAPNGTWDPETVIWTETRVVYTGQPAIGRIDGLNAFSRIYELDAGTPPFLTGDAVPFTGDKMYGVYFADWNFNPLSGLTKYEATTAFGNASAKLPNVPGTAEFLGANFRLLYCNEAETQCAYGPASSACTTSPCHVVPDVSDFSYGTYFDLAIKCVLAGPDTAYVKASLAGVTTPLWVNGFCGP